VHQNQHQKGSLERGAFRRARRLMLTLGAILPVASSGCYQGISIRPSCPAQLEVGQTGQLLSGASNAGQIATFLWEVVPADAGDIGDPEEPDTTFTAERVGTATLTLTASDGLFLVSSDCETQIVAP